MNLKISREQFHLMMAMKSELNNQDNGHVNLIMHHHIKYRYQDQFYIISYHIFDIMPLIYNISCRTKIHLSFSRLNTGYAAYSMHRIEESCDSVSSVSP